jgi:hypothetical protein
MFARSLAHYAHRHSIVAPKRKRLCQGKWGEVRCEVWISRLKCWDVDKYACEHVSNKKKEKNTSLFFSVLTQQRWPTLSATKQRNTLFPSQPTKWAILSKSSIQAEKKVPFLTSIPHLTFARSIHPEVIFAHVRVVEYFSIKHMLLTGKPVAVVYVGAKLFSK